MKMQHEKRSRGRKTLMKPGQWRNFNHSKRQKPFLKHPQASLSKILFYFLNPNSFSSSPLLLFLFCFPASRESWAFPKNPDPEMHWDFSRILGSSQESQTRVDFGISNSICRQNNFTQGNTNPTAVQVSTGWIETQLRSAPVTAKTHQLILIESIIMNGCLFCWKLALS